MNKQTKNFLLVGILMLLSACGPFGTPSAPVEVPQPVVTAKENTNPAPTSVPANALDSEKFSKYIGLTYPPLPEGLIENFGMVIWDTNDYGLSMVVDGAHKMLWLSKVIERFSDGSVKYTLLDVLGLSDLEPGLILLPDGCFLNGVPDSEIIVAGKGEVIVLAWRANTSLEKFEVVAIDGIQCSSDKAVEL